jgi:tRNA pseudouridine synthase 10
VLHRRSLKTREKEIFKMNAVRINDYFMQLCVLSSAGTYIKEFVHGDLGRTVPNIGSLMNTEVDILQLDVVKIFKDFENMNLEDPALFTIDDVDK